MPKYLIEREIPGVGKLSAQQLREISGKSRSVLHKLGPEIQWLHSYVTDDRVYCLYIAPNEAMPQEHAKQGGILFVISVNLPWERGADAPGR